jgi:hypothetical protein
MPWHNRLNLREIPLPLELFLGRGEFVILETELFTAHYPSPAWFLLWDSRVQGLVI